MIFSSKLKSVKALLNQSGIIQPREYLVKGADISVVQFDPCLPRCKKAIFNFSIILIDVFVKHE